MMQANDYSWLFKLTCRVLKYFLLFLVGIAAAYLLAAVFGALHLALPMLPFIGDLVLRLALSILGLMATAVIFESLRY
ncbi:MAG: hypothetical protein HC879_13660 [Leptolyngbyaceae cyanobacterium SL_5_9]|nr:hypothetical protein [Leptolyngbyaceae cyanobacterium SL_5_9]NJO74722.1 hypothetical protein [Leptolyngbyaceae cyanobacterium RM1_406_9]